MNHQGGVKAMACLPGKGHGKNMTPINTNMTPMDMNTKAMDAKTMPMDTNTTPTDKKNNANVVLFVSRKNSYIALCSLS